MTKSKKRMGRENAPARKALLEATARFLSREGYAKLTARKIAEEAGLKKQLLFYYFSDMDELIRETYVGYIEDFNKELEKTLQSKDPLRALWRLLSGGNGRLLEEFLTIASHSEEFRKEFGKYSRQHKMILKDFLETTINHNLKGVEFVTPELALFVILSIARNYLIEKDLRILECSDELNALLEWCFARSREA